MSASPKGLPINTAAENPVGRATRSRILRCGFLLACAVALAGCAHPSAANNKLREENQNLRERITELERQRAGDQATIKALESKDGPPPEVSAAKVGELFTVHGIRIGRLTGGDDWDASKPGQDGIKVAVEPFDETGEKIKAAGSFVVDAFDLSESNGASIGHWTFDVKQSRESWYGGAFLYGYVLKCPWQRVPAHKDLTVRVTFTDALTGRQFTEQKAIKAEPPSTSAATTRPAASP